MAEKLKFYINLLKFGDIKVFWAIIGKKVKILTFFQKNFKKMTFFSFFLLKPNFCRSYKIKIGPEPQIYLKID